MVRSRWMVLLALLWPLICGPPPAAAGDGIRLVPVSHRVPPPLRVKAWVDRGPDALYYPGERVGVRFTVNDDAYVCVYNIDTDGQVRVLFPSYGDDGFVSGHELVTLPGRYADFDYVVTGPPGIETVEVIASRAPLTDWDGAWEGEDEEWNEDDSEDWDEEENEDEDREDDDGEDEDEDDEDDEDDDEDEDDDDDDSDDRGGTWGTDHRIDGRPIPRPRPTGLTVSGDPFVAIRRVNRRLLPSPREDRDYDTAYISFCVGERVRYPRYTCNDCHGPAHGYDPYDDHCSVFSVRVNVRWDYPRHHVYVVHRHVLEPRYIYVRHQHVPSPYKHLKRAWSSHESSRLKKEFHGTPVWKSGSRTGFDRREKGTRPPASKKPPSGTKNLNQREESREWRGEGRGEPERGRRTWTRPRAPEVFQAREAPRKRKQSDVEATQERRHRSRKEIGQESASKNDSRNEKKSAKEDRSGKSKAKESEGSRAKEGARPGRWKGGGPRAGPGG